MSGEWRWPSNKLPTNIDLLVGQRIKELRVAAGKSQIDLADALGVTNQQICKYESGKNRISVGQLLVFAEEMNVRVEDLFSKVRSKPVSHRMALDFSKATPAIPHDLLEPFNGLVAALGSRS